MNPCLSHRNLLPFPTRRSSYLQVAHGVFEHHHRGRAGVDAELVLDRRALRRIALAERAVGLDEELRQDRKSTRLNSSHVESSYAVFCLKKKSLSKRSFFPLPPR